MTKQPRLIFWDIETTHNLAAVFQLKNDDYIPHDNIVQERYIMSAAWKIRGAKSVSAVSVLDDPKRYQRNPHDDFFVCETLHAMLSTADIVVAHNGDWYDIKFAETRMLAHGLPPLPPIQSIDTLKVARSRFLFNTNRLDYLGKFLRVGAKKPTPKGLWLRVLAGDSKALKEIVSYNKQDVLLLERVFEKLEPYIKINIHPTGCPRCGSKNCIARGTHRTLTQQYQRYQCKACGGWFREKLANKTGYSKRVL